MIKHPHYDVIVAWAADPKHTQVQYLDFTNNWQDFQPDNNVAPRFDPHVQYRIKPSDDQPIIRYGCIAIRTHGGVSLQETKVYPNVELHFDPLNNNLIKVELI